MKYTLVVWNKLEYTSIEECWRSYYFYIYENDTGNSYSVNTRFGLQTFNHKRTDLEDFLSCIYDSLTDYFLVEVDVDDVSEITIPFIRRLVEPELYL